MSAGSKTRTKSQERRKALKRFKQANKALFAVMSRLNSRGSLTAKELGILQSERKRKGSIKRWNLGPKAIDEITNRFRQITADLLQREANESAMDLLLGTLAPARSQTPMQDPYKPPEVDYKTVVGLNNGLGEISEAVVRTVLLGPVLTGSMTPRKCAAMWRRVFRGELTGEEAAIVKLFHEIPARFREKFKNLAHRTLNRWLAKVMAAQENATPGHVPPTKVILAHKTGIERIGTRKVEIDRVLDLSRQNPNWGGSNVGFHLRTVEGVDITDRRVQQIRMEHWADINRILDVGGPAAFDVAMRTRLHRDSAYPNEMWMIDHSWISMECGEPGGDEGDEPASDFDFQFEYIVETQRPGGLIVRRRAKGFWVTAVIDACTRRILNIRVWPKAPNSQTTLLAIAEAAARFGLPERLYTDNGSDFTSGVTRDALTAAGILHVLSLQYSPQGRGKIERLFGTMKEQVLLHLDGYTGATHKKDWNDDDLMTLGQVQEKLRWWAEEHRNGVKHSGSHRIPRDHYDELIGAQPMIDAGRLLPLLVRKQDATKNAQGVRLKNRFYWSQRGVVLMNPSPVVVHYDPFSPGWIHVSSPGPFGDLEYVGRFDVYDPKDAPAAGDVQHEDNAFLVALDAKQERDRAKRRWLANVDQAKNDGKALGRGLADELFPSPNLIASDDSSPLLLPAPDPNEPDDQDAGVEEDEGAVQAGLDEDDVEPAAGGLNINPWL